jgi:hypothetical protein
MTKEFQLHPADQDLIEDGVFEKKQKFQVGLSNIDAVNLMSRLMFCQWQMEKGWSGKIYSLSE